MQGLELQSERNPFHGHRDSFDSEVRYVLDVGHNFGSLPDLEREALKSRFVELEHQVAGRIRLPSLYAGGARGDWTSSESVDYLRTLDALAAPNPKKPAVATSKYMTSRTSRLTASGSSSVCCFGE